MKQTAVEWLVNKLTYFDITKEEDYDIFLELEIEAKEMEKQQKGYSEEELILYSDYVLMCSAEKTFKLPLQPKEWFEQFKNK